MQINSNADFDQLIIWLNQNLNSTYSITPHSGTIPNASSKGIYFWFMHPNGYDALSKFAAIKQITPRFTKEIEGVTYDLVYLGTAGTGKQGKSNISERLRWHIEQRHSEGSICSGILSTLRAGLGALLSNDLIETNTEGLINETYKQYFKLYWIEFHGFESAINSNEGLLINALKPLFNIKNNPNAKANALPNPTQFYKNRRVKVYDKTRQRLGCAVENEKTRKENNPANDTPKFPHQVIAEKDDGCIEYFVKKGQHIGKVTRGIEGLPLGKSKIEIFDSKDVNNQFTLWRRITGKNENHNSQNVYRYFDNTSTGNGYPRYVIMNNWMEDNNIEEITIRVCPIN